MSPDPGTREEDHVRGLLGDQVQDLRMVRENIAWLRFSAVEALPAYYKAYFGPVIAT